MKYYEAKALVTVGAGAILHLTDAQAAARSHGLVADGQAGRFKTKHPLQFKKGEVFGCDSAPAGALELKADAKDFEARNRAERSAAAKAKQQQLAERKARQAAIEAATRRKEEARRLAAEAKAEQLKGEGADAADPGLLGRVADALGRGGHAGSAVKP